MTSVQIVMSNKLQIQYAYCTTASAKTKSQCKQARRDVASRLRVRVSPFLVTTHQRGTVPGCTYIRGEILWHVNVCHLRSSDRSPCRRGTGFLPQRAQWSAIESRMLEGFRGEFISTSPATVWSAIMASPVCTVHGVCFVLTALLKRIMVHHTWYLPS